MTLIQIIAVLNLPSKIILSLDFKLLSNILLDFNTKLENAISYITFGVRCFSKRFLSQSK
jgi:hypothetical protein